MIKNNSKKGSLKIEGKGVAIMGEASELVAEICEMIGEDDKVMNKYTVAEVIHSAVIQGLKLGMVRKGRK